MTTPTRTGKIARLPHKLREHLNTRLKNGENARTLVAWLNARSDVKAILKEHFDAQPIREQNLSQWRHGGYQDWLLQQNSRDLSQTVDGDHTAWDHAPLPGALNHWLATHYTLTTRRIVELAQTDPDASHKLLRQMTRDIALLQRSDTQSRREQRQRDHQTFQEKQAAERTEQARQKTESARQQTEADHEAWALHPDNHDHLDALWKKAYPEDYFHDEEDTDEESDASHQDEDSALGHPERSAAPRGAQSKDPAPSSQHSANNPTPSVTSSPSHPEHSSPSSHPTTLSPSHPTTPDPTHVFDHTSGTYVPIDLDADDSTSPQASSPSRGAIPQSPSTISDQPSTRLQQDILDHLQSLETRLKSNPSYLRPRRPHPDPASDASSLYFDPWFIRGQRIRDGLDPETGELPPSRRPSKLPPPTCDGEALVRRILGDAYPVRPIH